MTSLILSVVIALVISGTLQPGVTGAHYKDYTRTRARRQARRVVAPVIPVPAITAVVTETTTTALPVSPYQKAKTRRIVRAMYYAARFGGSHYPCS